MVEQWGKGGGGGVQEEVENGDRRAMGKRRTMGGRER